MVIVQIVARDASGKKYNVSCEQHHIDEALMLLSNTGRVDGIIKEPVKTIEPGLYETFSGGGRYVLCVHEDETHNKIVVYMPLHGHRAGQYCVSWLEQFQEAVEFQITSYRYSPDALAKS